MFKNYLRANSDLAMVFLVVGVLLVLFVPIPSELLDFLILLNFSFALLILLLTFYMQKPVEFSTFPSLLLVATLFRLSLNIAATRLILNDGDAGRVIGAIGAYVVGGNYVIGLIVFLILIVVQYVVVTSGAQRVSEVAARFTLDSMPGQQMSIDADLNMGFIDQKEAQKRRKELGKEAGFYGAMDGASKFVKGDAIAGIVILLIDIVGGLVIGVIQNGMAWGEALRAYTLLTIGDGIVTQVPALVISVGTGIIVTRSASDSRLSNEVLRQIGGFPKTLILVALALCGLALLPGIPAVPALVISTLIGCIALVKRKQAADNRNADSEANDSQEGTSEIEESYAALTIEPVEVLLGVHLVPLVGDEGSLVMERIAAFRKQYAIDSGLVLPSIRFKDGPRLSPSAYEINIFGVTVARSEVLPDHVLAISPTGNLKKLRGIETREPTYGLPAVWIEEAERESAKVGKFTLVDATTVFITHLCEVLRQQAANLLTRQETEKVLSRLRQQQPGLVEETVPTVLSMSDVQRVLQNLLREKVSIRNIEAIMEALADHSKTTKDVAQLTELVRQRLGPTICQSLVGATSSLQVLTLDPEIEHSLIQTIRSADNGGALIIDPKLAEQIISKLAAQADRMVKSNLLPVLLCAPDLRRHIKSLSERVLPHLRVLSMSEIPNSIDLRAFAMVSLAA